MPEVILSEDPAGGAITEWKGKKVPPEGRTAPLHGGQ